MGKAGGSPSRLMKNGECRGAKPLCTPLPSSRAQAEGSEAEGKGVRGMVERVLKQPAKA